MRKIVKNEWGNLEVSVSKEKNYLRLHIKPTPYGVMKIKK